MTENKKIELGRISFLIGFGFALIGHMYHKQLWDYAFYHFIALAFIGYILEGWLVEKNYQIRCFRFAVLMFASNSFIDELRGVAGVLDVSELIFAIVVLIYTIYLLKIKKK